VWGIKIPQRLLKVKDDGVVGPGTLNQLNNVDFKLFHSAIKQARIDFVNDLVKNRPDNQKFLKGWLNRINSFVYA